MAWRLTRKSANMLMELHPEAIRLNPNDDSAFINRGMAYARKGANYRAIADYNEAIQLDPKSALAFCSRGRAKLQVNEPSGNIATAKRLDASTAHKSFGLDRRDHGRDSLCEGRMERRCVWPDQVSRQLLS